MIVVRKFLALALNTGTILAISMIAICLNEAIAAEDFLDRLMKACSEGDQKACVELDRLTEQHRDQINRLNAQADAFQAEAKTLGLQTGHRPNLEKAYPIILHRYMDAGPVEPIHKERGLAKQLIPLCAKSFHDLFFVHGNEIPVLSSGEPNWAVIYIQTIEHYFRHCSKKGGT